MYFISGPIIQLLTFPGVLIYQFWYLIACRYYKVTYVIDIASFSHFISEHIASISASEEERIGKKVRKFATLMSAIICCFAGLANEFTVRKSALEWVLVWIAISIGVQTFPLRNAPGGKMMRFIWLDAFYGMILYFIGKLPLAAIATCFPELGLSVTKLY